MRRLEVHLNLRGCRHTDPRTLRRRRAFGCRAALSSKSRTWDYRSQETLAIGSCAGELNESGLASPGFPAREYDTLGGLILRTRELSGPMAVSIWPQRPHPTHPRVAPRETQVLFRIVVAGLPPRTSHAQLAGRASVTDGDTVRVAGARVRLHGIDAPESQQTCVAGGSRWRCGAEATRALARRIGGRPIACEERDRDRYGRIVAVCRVRGEDLNRWMVRQGWALAYRHYSMDYVPDERAARAAKRGLWRGDFVPPWRWRKGERIEGAASKSGKSTSGRCRIKGNISRKGVRIYHAPGGQSYNQTRINTSKGERWFCSESEARVAGWRKARR